MGQLTQRGPYTVTAHLTELAEAERHALRRGRTLRRGQGYSLHITALPEVRRSSVDGHAPRTA
jgi:putative DNA-invertase from lambdoid prophage Rac